MAATVKSMSAITKPSANKSDSDGDRRKKTKSKVNRRHREEAERHLGRRNGQTRWGDDYKKKNKLIATIQLNTYLSHKLNSTEEITDRRPKQR